MYKIRFGTDGWRAIIAQDFTVDNVKRVAYATAQWVKNEACKHENLKPAIVLGHDCRFGGEMFSLAVMQVMAQEGVHVMYHKGIATTPMVSLGTHDFKCFAGVVITASHNPPAYSGYKLKSFYGGPTKPDDVALVESHIPDHTIDAPNVSLEKLCVSGHVSIVDLEMHYLEKVEGYFDLDTIRKSKLLVAYDAMFGAGFPVFKKILPEATMLHAEPNPGFNGQAPEPIAKNLQEFGAMLEKNHHDIGFATDGDADRIGLVKGNGEILDAHHAILILLHILKEYKQYDGTVIAAFSATPKVKMLCDHHKLSLEVTKIGFKHISGRMIEVDSIIGCEESGGIAVKGHIPERDGIWDALLVIEHLAQTGKSLEDLIQEIYAITGSLAYNRNDMHLTNEVKMATMERCASGEFNKNFGKYTTDYIENIDGFKFHFKEGGYVMIRPSGTEPVLRVYAESATMDLVDEILTEASRVIQGG